MVKHRLRTRVLRGSGKNSDRCQTSEILKIWNQGIQIYLNPLVASDPEGRGRAGQGWRLRLHKRAKRSAEDGGALEGTGGRAPLRSFSEFR
jgi:hypothetical protein